jgi:hypothetical protein
VRNQLLPEAEAPSLPNASASVILHPLPWSTASAFRVEECSRTASPRCALSCTSLVGCGASPVGMNDAEIIHNSGMTVSVAVAISNAFNDDRGEILIHGL